MCGAYCSPMNEQQIEKLRRGIDALVREFKIADAVPLRDGGPSLNPSDVQTLIYVGEHDGCIARDVATVLGVTPTSVSTIVDRLVRRNYMSRRRTEENRRVVVLSLTDDGRDDLVQILDEQRRHCAAMLATLTPKERDQFVAQIATIANGVNRSRSGDTYAENHN